MAHHKLLPNVQGIENIKKSFRLLLLEAFKGATNILRQESYIDHSMFFFYTLAVSEYITIDLLLISK